MSCRKIVLLCSRSRAQQEFETLLIVCPDGIFWIILRFVAKLSMVMHHHQPECLWKDCFAMVSVKVRMRVNVIKYDHSCCIHIYIYIQCCLILLQSNVIWWYIVMIWSNLWNIGLLCSQSRSWWWLKTSWNVFSPVFCSTDIFEAKLGVWIWASDKRSYKKWDNALEISAEFNERTSNYFPKHDIEKIIETEPVKSTWRFPSCPKENQLW